VDYAEYPVEGHLIDALLRYLEILKNRITIMDDVFVSEKIVDPSILSTKSKHSIYCFLSVERIQFMLAILLQI
jgi:hypothetical protein